VNAVRDKASRDLGLLDAAVAQLNQVVLGKDREVRLAVACLLARGHLLIEDIPGVGKTTLAHALARVLGLSYQRIQFTSDLLPADIIGVSVYDRGTGAFQFHRGPVFAQLVLADEVNRATPKAQSALLEAMEERQVTVDGESNPLPEPFFVVATQNPSYQVGTFPLPESQLDRFLMRIELGYPAASHERALLRGRDRRDVLASLPPVLDPETIVSLQRLVPEMHASDALIDYVQALTRASRDGTQFQPGLSTRASIALLRAAQAWAFLNGHAGVLPEDLQAVLPVVVGHRLRPRDPADRRGPPELARALLEAVPIP
jgi:MoxR-like ATPase